MMWRLCEADGRWTELSATEILDRLERGELELEQQLSASESTTPRALRHFLRELVWMARREEEEDLVHQPLYFAIADAAPVPTAISDLGGRLTYVNRAFCEFIGYQWEELIGVSVSDLSHPEDHKNERDQGNQLISGRQQAFQMKKRYLTKNGGLREGLLSIAMLTDPESGNPSAVLAQIADLTPLKELEEALTQARAHSMLRRVAERTSHDLKNLLMILQGTFDILQSYSDFFSEEDQALLQEGFMICDSGRQLVQTLLDSEGTRRPLKRLSLNAWLQERRSLLIRAVSPYPIEFVIASEFTFLCDELLLERAILNLCVNAKQALKTAEEQEQAGERLIRFTARPSTEEEAARLGARGALTLALYDSGVGIPLSLQSRVLEPYFTTRCAEGGSGLGLATVWAACERHQGSLKLESEEGAYTCFNLIFPLPEDE